MSTVAKQQIKHPSPTAIMNASIKRIALQKQAKRVFVMWPNLRKITTRFCHYTTQLVASDKDECLIDTAIQSALESFEAHSSKEDECLRARAYVMALTSHANQLIKTAISGKSGRNYVTWMPFREPISEWMEKVNVNTLVISAKKYEVDDGHAQALLLGNILTFEDMQSFGIRLAVDKET